MIIIIRMCVCDGSAFLLCKIAGVHSDTRVFMFYKNNVYLTFLLFSVPVLIAVTTHP